VALRYPRNLQHHAAAARIYANEGLCQILFFQSDEVCETSYADRKGKYQAQKGIVLPKL
jgi:dCTP deaminase